MIKHSLTLEHVARCLNERLVNKTLIESWTQEKNAVLLHFYSTVDECVVRISVEQDTASIRLYQQAARARKNTIDVFPSLIGSACRAVVKIDGDRIVTLVFPTANLHVLFFSGGKGNVVLERDGRIVDALHDRAAILEQPFSVDARPLTLGPVLERERPHYDDVVEAYRKSRTAFILRDQDGLHFSMLPLHNMEIVERSDDILGTLHRVVTERYRSQRSMQLKKALLSGLDRELRKLKKAVEAMESDRAQADHAGDRRRIADLLMSVPDVKRKDLENIELTTWEGAEITVKLDPTKTILENAQAYYAKARRSEQAAIEREQRLPKTKARIAELENQRDLVSECEDITILEQLLKRPMTSNASTSESSPYRVFVLDEEYTLYVGKNAANNDQLTMKFAKQNDWWFHARGTSGSHCVLRGPGSTKPPKSILEQAAAISAYYSGARNASWVPVVYTQRKHVRKPKGSNVGAVVLDREDVIMVKPGLPVGSSDQI